MNNNFNFLSICAFYFWLLRINYTAGIWMYPHPENLKYMNWWYFFTTWCFIIIGL